MATTTSITPTWDAGSGGAPSSYNLRWRRQGDADWIEIDGIADTFYVITGLLPGVTYEWQVQAENADGISDWSETATCATSVSFVFLSCQNGWTVTAPVMQFYGLDHLIGMVVVGLADGVPIDPQVVAADGSVTIPFPASNVKFGLAFLPQVQTPYLDAGNPTAQGRRKNVVAVTARVDNSAGVEVGTNQPDGAAQQPPAIAPAWTNMQADPTFPAQTYMSPGGATVTKLATGDLRVPVTAEWAKPGQVAVQQPLPLPMNLIAVIPEVLEGDTIEQAYSPRQDRPQGQPPRGPGAWMLRQ